MTLDTSTYTEHRARHAELDRLEKLARENVHTCGASLSVAIKEGVSTLRCGKCNRFIEEGELVKRRGLARQYQDGEILNPAIVNRIEMKEAKKLAQEIGVDKARQLSRYQGTVTLSRDQAREIAVTLWPKAPDIEIKKAVMVCTQYQLNPLMKHVFLVPYTSKKTGATTWALVIGIKASRLMACRKGTYSYLDNTPRVMTEAEQMTINGEVQPDRMWAIVKLRDEKTSAVVQGTGYWPIADFVQGGDKGNSKQNMACIRAERQAMDRLRPGEMPSDVEVADERFVEGQVISVDEDGVIDENIPSSSEGEDTPLTKQDDKDPLASWTGTSRPQQASTGPQKTASEIASGTIGQGEAEKATVSTPPKATEEQLGRLRNLLGDNYQKFHIEIQKRHNCYPSEMTAELAAAYIRKMEKKGESDGKIPKEASGN